MKMVKVNAGALMAACMVMAGEGACAGPTRLESFQFPYAHGRVEQFTDVQASQPALETLARIQQRHPSIGNITLFCSDVAGPRLAQIDGIFFALNEKAARRGASVTTEQGDFAVYDIERPPSPLAGDYLTILQLTREADEACQLPFR